MAVGLRVPLRVESITGVLVLPTSGVFGGDAIDPAVDKILEFEPARPAR